MESSSPSSSTNIEKPIPTVKLNDQLTSENKGVALKHLCVNCSKEKKIYHKGSVPTWNSLCDKSDPTVVHFDANTTCIKKVKPWDNIGTIRQGMSEEARNKPNCGTGGRPRPISE